MAYKRYRGNSGRSERVETPEETETPPFREMPRPGPPPGPPPRPPGPPGGEFSLEALLSRFDPGRLEREDWLVLGILWLLYRLSGDTELLIALGMYLML